MNDTAPRRASFRTVREVPASGLPWVVHPEWREAFPWLVQGSTGRGEDADPFDLALFGEASPAGAVSRRWEALLRGTGFTRAVHARQVHGAAVRVHGRGAPGLLVTEPCDGHATRDADVLMAVTTADCVPVSVVDPKRRAAALLHAGWRGAAAGILERGVAVLAERAASRAADLHVHLGPSICGRCYEVGPEVFEALGPAPSDGSRAPGSAGGAGGAGRCGRCRAAQRDGLRALHALRRRLLLPSRGRRASGRSASSG